MNTELRKIFKKINDYGVLVMFSHTIFSLSFALISMLLAGEGKLSFKNYLLDISCLSWELEQGQML